MVSGVAATLLVAVTAPALGQPGASDAIGKRRLAAKSDEEKIGQLLFVGFDDTGQSTEPRTLVRPSGR